MAQPQLVNESNRSLRKIISIILIHVLFVQLLLGLGLLLVNIPADSLVYPCSLLMLLLSIWLIGSWKWMGNQLFDPYILFLIAAICFNAGQILLEVFHQNKDGILRDVFSSNTIVKTELFVMLGLVSFHFGAILNNFPKQKKLGFNSTLTPSPQEIRTIGWSLLAISCVPSFLLLKNAIIIVLTGGYFEFISYSREVPIGFAATSSILADFLVPSALFILAGSKGNNKFVFLSGFIILCYSTIMFFLGSRSNAVMPLIAYFWLFDRVKFRIPRSWLLGAGAIFLFFIFPFVAFIRDYSIEDRLYSSLAEAFFSKGNPAISSISEMGNSMSTVAYTFDLIPSIRGFDWGISYFYALLTLIPNLFWSLHPSVAHGLAGYWLIWQVDPSIASKGGGLGFSFIAEAFLNFGWFGLIVLFLMGYFYSKFVLSTIQSGDYAKLAMVACFLSFFLFFARGESGSYVRSLVWYSLIPYYGLYIVRMFSRK